MEATLALMNSFEERNNLSISLLLHGDGSGTICEFWNQDEIKTFHSIADLHSFLSNGNLKKDESGLSVSPTEIIK